MTYATIYRMSDGTVYADGLQSSVDCDEAIIEARRAAKELRKSVVVEDGGSLECYRVTPSGYIWSAPNDWVPSWEYDQ